MSLDLYEIGANLIPASDVNTSVNEVIEKLAKMHHAEHKSSDALNFSNITHMESIRLSSAVETLWSLAADAAQHLTEASEGTFMAGQPQDGEFISDVLKKKFNTNADGHLMSDSDFIADEITRLIARKIAMNPHDEASHIHNYLQTVERHRQFSPDLVNLMYNLALHRSEPSDVLENVKLMGQYHDRPGSAESRADEVDASRQFGPIRQADYIAFDLGDVEAKTKMFDSLPVDDLSGLMGEYKGGYSAPIKSFDAGPHRTAEASGGGITSQSYQEILEHLGRRDLVNNDPAVLDVADSQTDISDTVDVSGSLLAQIVGSASSLRANVNDRARFEEGHLPSIQEFSEYMSAAQNQDDPGAAGEIKSGGRNTSAELANASDRFALLTSDAPPTAIAALFGQDEVPSGLGDWAKNYPSIAFDVDQERQSHADAPALAFGFGSPPIANSIAAEGRLAATETAGAGAHFESDGIATGSGPPGWLVALTGAVVMELMSTGFHTNANTSDGRTAIRQSAPAPKGTRSDPLHVRVVDQLFTYGTHMPAGPTSHLPSQSMPVPGQVLFSP